MAVLAWPGNGFGPVRFSDPYLPPAPLGSSASRGNGFRYDHALASPPLDARIRSVRYSQELRAAGLSDHAGLVVELG
jgi:endonuclease/exonuclease/phosphatase family metal-dependent hydrolase